MITSQYALDIIQLITCINGILKNYYTIGLVWYWERRIGIRPNDCIWHIIKECQCKRKYFQKPRNCRKQWV